MATEFLKREPIQLGRNRLFNEPPATQADETLRKRHFSLFFSVSIYYFYVLLKSSIVRYKSPICFPTELKEERVQSSFELMPQTP